ncbi:MAG: GNAT family N-acetyltransferase [Microcoleaceae cyanobacterium]
MEKLAFKDYKTLHIESLVKNKALFRFKDEIIFVAVLAEKMVVFSCVNIHKPQINSLFVSPEFARQGIGTKLLETIEKIAIPKKQKFIYSNMK